MRCNVVLAMIMTGNAGAGQAADDPPVFGRHIMPIFSKAGCNSGSCHGTFAGKNGFRLSLFGYEPEMDFERLTREANGRRIDRLDSASSLLLLKGTGQIPHAGGKRFERTSPEYQSLLRWIEAGAKYDPKHESSLERVEVIPGEAMLRIEPGAVLQFVVKAVFADGHSEDVTPLAVYSSLDEGIAQVDHAGRVSARRTGDTFIIVSYLGKFGRFQALVPAASGKQQADVLDGSKHFIDEHIRIKLKRLNIPASPLCDDATFLRRVMIDLIGVTPTPDEVRSFIKDRQVDKRAQKIDELLARPEYAQWWASKFSDFTGNDNRYLGVLNYKDGYNWWNWLHVRLEQNMPYDELVRNILLATSREGRAKEEFLRWREDERPRMEDLKRWDTRYHERQTLDLFWSKSTNRAPEVVGQEISYSFLGMKLECAQCHKHPFDRWTQDDFWGFAAFFTRIQFGVARDLQSADKSKPRAGKELFIAGKGDLWIPVRDPKTKDVLSPRTLDGKVYPDADDKDPRVPLAKWMTASDNSYFARALVNRIWAHHLGRGLIEPTDAFSEANPPSHPQLLDALTRDFVAHHFDLKHLHRTILNSRTYQLSAQTSAGNAEDTRNYSHYYVKRLHAEVLVDAIHRVTDCRGEGKAAADYLVPPGVNAIAYPLSRSPNALRYPFRIFGRPLRVSMCDCERDQEPSLPQALYLLNDGEMLTKIRSAKGRLAAMLTLGKTDAELIDELYLWALGRSPTQREVRVTKDHLAEWVKDGDRAEAFQDVLWSLMNLKEFNTNH